MAKRLVYGVGINDADYQLNRFVQGKKEVCPFYQRWKDMLKRCYSHNYQKNRKTYSNCRVCDEWLTFSNFKQWMGLQDWRGKSLDKDILQMGNCVYAPNLCVFVDERVNSFILDSRSSRGRWPIGVYLDKRYGKFSSQCSNPFSKENERLGYFDCPLKANLAWKKRKNELAHKLAETQSNDKVAKALRDRYM